MIDVVIAGAGPAGWAIASACARNGLVTELIDPSPDRPWRATYGAWRAELPVGLRGTIAASGRGVAIGTAEHRLDGEYAVLDNAALRDALAAPGVAVNRGTVRGVRRGRRGAALETASGDRHAAVVVDATGQRRVVLGRASRRPAAEQTAVGVVLDQARAASLVRPGEALFMDWRNEHGEAGWPTFLYGVPVAPGRVLLEETSLARRPGLPLPVLRRRLRARMSRYGINPPRVGEERVRFAVDTPLPPAGAWFGPVVPFGVAAPLMHPATGFSVAAALRLAPRLAAAIRDGLDRRGPGYAAAAAWRTVWSPSALAVYGMRSAGLRALLSMPVKQVPAFFDVFFELAPEHRWAYLTGREDLAGTAAAMGALFRAAPWPLARHLVLRGLDPRRVVNHA